MMADDYSRGAVDAYMLIMRAFQEVAPEPHNDPAEPSAEFLRLDEAIVDVLREVAEGRLALFDPADLGDDFAGEARPVANAILERHRRLARAIVEAAG